MKLALIGYGTIAHYVIEQLANSEHQVAAIITSPSFKAPEGDRLPHDLQFAKAFADIEGTIDLFVDCAGHGGLMAHGEDILRAGHDLLTVSIGAFADQNIHGRLHQAAKHGNSNIILASGAIGALDILRSARTGTLKSVCYKGRKPPRSWKGSPAETILDLDSEFETPQQHFRGTAREAALQYPKNANVAAAVALSGIGFDETMVELIADPSIERNIHEIEAEGAFGKCKFEIECNPMPSNPRTSALAAMSVIANITQYAERLKF